MTEVCRRLDGIPLAIELAAARMRVLGIEGITALVDQRYRLLRTAARGVPARHQTLQAVADWSYEQLTELAQAAALPPPIGLRRRLDLELG